jgi:peptide/nickel transport system substrate-binding protein
MLRHATGRPTGRPTALAATVTVLLALGLLAAGCSGSQTSNASTGPAGTFALNESKSGLEPDDVTPATGGKLVVAVPAETNGWNPTVNQWADAGSLVGPSIIEPLVTMDKDGTAEPYLLESFKPNATFTQWDLTLKPDIVFHDGAKLDAAAMKQNIDAKFAPGSLTALASTGYYDHTDVTGPLSVRVTLAKPWSQFTTSLNSTYMLAPSMLAREDRGTVHPVGTGAFKFESWEQNRSLVVKKFEHYWRKDKAGRQLPYLDEIEFRPIIDDETQTKALQAGDVDLALTTSAAVASSSQDAFTVLRDYTSERTFVLLNTDVSDLNAGNPFTNVHARKALAYATNRDDITAQVGDQVQSTTQGYRPDSKWGLAEDQTGYYTYDIDKAKQEVEAYKQETHQPSLTFTLLGIPDLGVSTTMQVLQDQWKQAGIDAKLDSIDQVKYITLVALGEYQAAWFRYYGYPNPDSNFSVHSSTAVKPIGSLSVDFSHYHSATLDQNLEVGRTTDDFTARKQANDAVIREVNNQAINIWLYDTPYAVVAEPRVHGLNSFRTHPFGNFTPKPWLAEAWLAAK